MAVFCSVSQIKETTISFFNVEGFVSFEKFVAYLWGDYKAEEKVELGLTETGVCSISNSPAN
ncbi:hypothetical protein PMSD_17690 [Paenibacillus macquariensis subsp. defensor]|nr:hypothetical protein PMSD_17690 [Paenibacillus macquariensis subsp. defensor]